MLIISMWLHLQILTYQIPRPIFGGINFICYGMVLAVGVSMLSYLDLNQLRWHLFNFNKFFNFFYFFSHLFELDYRQPVIIGFTVFFSVSLRKYFIFSSSIYRHEAESLHLIFREFLASVVIIGLLVSCILDNILPGFINLLVLNSKIDICLFCS